jgi:hypothetical protein
MSSVVFFIEHNAIAICTLCGAGLLWWGWRLLGVRRELSQAQFELEREQALNKRARYIDLAGLCVLVILATVALAQVVAPYLRTTSTGGTQISRAASGDLFVTHAPGVPAALPPVAAGTTPPPEAVAMIAGTPTPSPTRFANATDIFAGQVEATYTPSPTPPGTIIPDVPPPVGCADPGVRLTHPVNGQVLFEAVVVTGSANTAGFSSYKFELNGPSTDNAWAVLRTYTNPVADGVLGQFDGSAFTAGTYQFRLAVVDSSDSTIASCAITVVISEPIPTPTRIHSG